MKKLLTWMLAALMLISAAYAEIDLSGMDYDELVKLRDQVNAAIAEMKNDAPHVPVTIKPSPDKYTWYMQDYVGRNAAGFGYTSLGGDRLEEYGHGHLQFCFVTEDGSYLDFSDSDLLKQYTVVGQNIEPNTEIKMTYRKDSEGNEYSNLIEFQSIKEIDLLVRKIGSSEAPANDIVLIPINPAPDKYTCYMKNYIGKNVYAFGYTSLGGDRMDEYGDGHIEFVFVADDGAYIDPDDADLLKQYIVTGQDIAPNTEIRMTYMTDSSGKEYDNLVDTQTYKSITLYVKKLDA